MLYAYYKESTINYVSITRVNCINHRSDLAAKIKRRLPSVSLVKNEGVVAPQRSCPKVPKPAPNHPSGCSSQIRSKPVCRLLLSPDMCVDCHKFNAVDMALQTFWQQPPPPPRFQAPGPRPQAPDRAPPSVM